MPFTVEEFRDLLKLLEARPEWRTELRRLVLTDELLTLPQQMAALRARSEEQFQALVIAQQRTEAHVEALTVRLDTLTAHVDGLTVRLDTLTAHVDGLTVRLDTLTAHVETLTAHVEALTSAQQRLETRVVGLEHAQQRTDVQLATLTDQVTALVAAQQRTNVQLATLTDQVTALVVAQQRTDTRVATLSDDVGELKGDMLEARYRAKGQTYFHAIVRRPHVLTADELTTLIEDAREMGMLSDAEADDLSEVDVVVRGRHPTDGTMAYVVVEVSWGVGPYDVERALRRAALLAQTRVTTIPVVAGKWITPEAAQFAHRAQVWQLTDGRVIPPTTGFGSS